MDALALGVSATAVFACTCLFVIVFAPSSLVGSVPFFIPHSSSHPDTMNTLVLVSRRHLSSAVARAATTRAAGGLVMDSSASSGCNRAYGSEADGGPIRVDWSREEVKAVYEMPFLELIHRAAGVHRAHNDPSMVQYVVFLPLLSGGWSGWCLCLSVCLSVLLSLGEG